ncbi:MAG: hypothetical protein ACTSW7_03735 [Candidatus Thorarchaeota archaeon]
MNEDRDINGILKDHYQTCDECDGTGWLFSDDYNHEKCYECDGEGHQRWGSWYGDEKGDCDYCGVENIPCSFHVYEHKGVCFDCYVEHHKKSCGCKLWKKWECE